MQLQQDFGRIGCDHTYDPRIQLCHSQAKLISTPDFFDGLALALTVGLGFRFLKVIFVFDALPIAS